MAVVKINSRLKHFKLLERIIELSDTGIRAAADLDDLPMYTALEAMAQLAALHVRHGLKFGRHAFLLKVVHSRWPGQDGLSGRFRLSANLRSRSSNAFAYDVRAQGRDGMALDADLLIGTTPYDGAFREDLLKAHYQEILEKLQSESKPL